MGYWPFNLTSDCSSCKTYPHILDLPILRASSSACHVPGVCAWAERAPDIALSFTRQITSPERRVWLQKKGCALSLDLCVVWVSPTTHSINGKLACHFMAAIRQVLLRPNQEIQDCSRARIDSGSLELHTVRTSTPQALQSLRCVTLSARRCSSQAQWRANNGGLYHP